MSRSQKDIWFESEGDNWFERNKDNLGKKQDLILLLIDFYNLKPETIVENGYRLAALHERYGSRVIGVDPSEKATKEISADIDDSNVGTVSLLRKKELYIEDVQKH